MSSGLIYHQRGESNQSADGMDLRRRYLLEIDLSEILKLLSEDLFFPESLRLASEAVFAERKDKANYIDYELKVYKGTGKHYLRIFLYFILYRDYPWFRIAGQF